jgi:chemotaxis protein histidine kinase CheA
MDGTIHVETEKNQGSTFTVKFPRPTEASSNEMSSEVSDAEVAEA